MYEKSFRRIVTEVDFQILCDLAVKIIGLIRREVRDLCAIHLARSLLFLRDCLTPLIYCLLIFVKVLLSVLNNLLDFLLVVNNLMRLALRNLLDNFLRGVPEDRLR